MSVYELWTAGGIVKDDKVEDRNRKAKILCHHSTLPTFFRAYRGWSVEHVGGAKLGSWEKQMWSGLPKLLKLLIIHPGIHCKKKI
jgi:hypothetical protein